MTALAEGPFTRLEDRPLTIPLSVPYERLSRGPVGARFTTSVRGSGSSAGRPLVLDSAFEAVNYRDVPCPADLERLLGDRAFLAQHGYAVAASTLDLFESTMGRRLGWKSRGHRLTLKLFEPISFEQTGYDAQRGEIRFGHMRDGRSRHHVPMALYRDLVAHEVTHAILDGYRPHLADPDGTVDEHAIHEGFSDLVAMLSVFSSTDRVAEQLRVAAAIAGEGTPIDEQLVDSGLFGVADGLFSRAALRRSVGDERLSTWRSETEPHRRGEVLVRAVMDLVLGIWHARMDRPGGRASEYQIAESGAKAGRQVLGMLIRGLGYTPPIDVTFEDVLRGMLAADLAVIPDDEMGYRRMLRESFAAFGLASDPDSDLDGLHGLRELRYPVRLSSLASDPEEVYRFLWENGALLRAAAIDPDVPVVVERVRPSLRVGPDGFVVAEIGASFVQQVPMSEREARRRLGLRVSGPVVLRGGGLIRFNEGGRLAYAALKPVLDQERQQSRIDEAAGPSLLNAPWVEIVARRANVFTSMHTS